METKLKINTIEGCGKIPIWLETLNEIYKYTHNGTIKRLIQEMEDIWKAIPEPNYDKAWIVRNKYGGLDIFYYYKPKKYNDTWCVYPKGLCCMLGLSPKCWDKVPLKFEDDPYEVSIDNNKYPWNQKISLR